MKAEKINLLEKYQDDMLSEAELNQFLQWLEEDENFRKESIQALSMKGMLRSLQYPDSESIEDEVIKRLSSSGSEFEDDIIKNIKNDKLYLFQKWLKFAIAAQVIFIPLFYFIFSTSNTPKNSIITASHLIAHVEKLEGFSFIVRGQTKLNPQEGFKIYSGDNIYVQDKSKLQLVYTDGSTLAMDKSSFVRLSEADGQKKVDLFSGEIKAKITPQKKKMLIQTEHSSAEVLGTEFTLTSSDISSLLDVKEGAVRFLQGDDSVVVKTNQFVTSAKGQPLDVEENDRALYTSPLVDLETPGHKVKINVDINDSSELFLVISNGGDNNRFDHGAWLSPTLSGPKGSIKLTELPRKIAKTGWRSIGINTGIEGNPLQVEGEVYENGISAHATSILAWDLPPGYTKFSAEGALLDSGAYRGNRETVPSMHFEIYTSMPEKKLKKLLIRRHHY